MNPELFDSLEKTLRSQGPGAGFAQLIGGILEEKNYPLLFEARLMQKRHEMGLPLLYSGPISDLPAEKQSAYEAAGLEAARETGELFLASGDIPRAWTYFRAIGDPAPVSRAIEQAQAGEGIEPVIDIALTENVNPRKGFELLIERHGICRAIDYGAQYRNDGAIRRMFLDKLVRTLYRDLTANLVEAIGADAAPGARVAELIAGRDWLFEGARHYIENSHLASVVQLSVELEDRETLRMAWELSEYGQRLAPMLHFEGQPPFQDTHRDYGEYLRALLDENREAAVEHFRGKVQAGVPGAPEALVGLLSRLGRYQEAIAASLTHLGGEAGFGCPSAVQLSQMAGDFQRLREVARSQGDVLGFVAGVIAG